MTVHEPSAGEHAALSSFSLGAAAREFGWRLARVLLPGGDAAALTALSGAASLALVRSEQGHAYLDFDAPVLLPRTAAPSPDDSRESVETVAFDGHRPWLAVLAASGVLSDAPLPGAPLVLEGSRLYLRRMWEDERALATWLSARAAEDGGTEAAAAARAPAPTPARSPQSAAAPHPAPAWLEPLLRAAFDERSPSEQVDAVRRSLHRGLSVITGGPGTGKTFVVARVLLAQGVAFALRHGRPPAVAMLAPTGKAARRVDESVLLAASELQAPIRELRAKWVDAPPVAGAADALLAATRMLEALKGRASTIHMALETDPRGGARFKRNETRSLDADLIVVDEASMVSLAIMRSLCAAVAPSAALTLLGDRAQLQSVEAGSVLSDIDGAPTALAGVCSRLSVSRRFPESSGLGRLARAIRDGDGEAIEAMRLLDEDPDVRAQVRLVEPAIGRTTSQVTALAAEHFASLRDATKTPQERLARLGEFAVLCGHRRGPAGADEVNAAFLRRHAPAGAHPGAAFDGMPLLVLHNSRDAGVSNGDCGIVCRGDNGALYAHFEGDRRVRVEMLPEFTAAYALTVHKSQGSEYGSLALVLPERESPVLTRELVYTALTRWKARKDGQGVTIIARRAVLEAALKAHVQRASGLRERLA